MFFDLNGIAQSASHWGIAGMTILYLLESMGLPAPVELPLAISGLLLVSQKADSLTLIIITWLSSSLGNLAILLLARTRLSNLYFKLARRFIGNETLSDIDKLVNRYGVLVIIFTRWVNWCFGLTLWVCSLHKISPKKFILTVVINNLLWAIFWVYFGGWLMTSIAKYKISWWFLLVIPIILLFVSYLANILRKYFRRR